MRVLHVFKVYLPDSFTGIERVIWQIAESTAPLGVETDVLSLSRTNDVTPIQVGQHRSHRAKLDAYWASTGISFSLFGHYARLAALADVIHFHFPWPMMDLLHLLRNARKPTVLTYHSDIVRQRGLALLYRPLMERFLSQVDAIVATSPDYARTSPVLRRFAGKVSIIPIGIDDAKPVELPARVGYWRQRLGERFFLFVGALRYYKGLTYLLEAARLSNLPLVIAGAGELPAIEQALAHDNVTYLGEVAEGDKQALLSLCTAFVFPSHLRSEAFGVALLEAARAGKPLISCEIGTGTSFINQNGVTGLTVAPANAAALATAMQTIWGSPEMAATFGQNSRARYESTFRASEMGRAYAALYHRVLRRGAEQ